MIIDKIPPQVPDMEKAVIGCMMIEQEALEVVLDALVPDDFYDNKNRVVFCAARELFSKGLKADLSVIASELKRAGSLADIGGAEYLAEAVNSFSTTAHLDTYIGQVKDAAIRRTLVNSCGKIAEACFEGEDTAETLLDHAEGFIYQAYDKRTRKGCIQMSDLTAKLSENVETVYKTKKAVTGLSTGFPSLDGFTGGLQKGNYAVIAGRPGMGKTALALNIMQNVTVNLKIPSLLFSLEMSEEEISLRFLSTLTGIPLYNLRTGFFGKDKIIHIQNIIAKMHDAPMFFDHSLSNTIMSIRSTARRLAGKLAAKGTPLGLVVIDYIQLITGMTGKRYGTRNEEVSDISRGIKSLARDLNLPIIALSQLNRNTEERGGDGRPRQADLRESGSLEQDSDLIAFIYRPALYKKDSTDEEKARTKLIIAKQRNGGLGDIDMVFRGETVQFLEMDKSEKETINSEKQRADIYQ